MAKDLKYFLKFDTNGRKVMSELGISSEQLDAALTKVKKTTTTTRQSMLSMASATVVFDGLQSAVSGLYTVMKDLSDAYAVQVEAERKLETVMRQRMKATDEQTQGVKDLASAQQQIGIIGDEVQLAGAQQLATFLSQTSTLRELIPAMNDLVAQQKGYAATGNDAVAVANLMGKAMQGQASALRRVGITFDDAQEAMLKNGNESERAAMLAEIITANVGHMNAELAKTPTGQLKQLENNLGDIKEVMGGFANTAMPFLTFGNQAVMAGTNVLKLTTATKGAVMAVSKLSIASRAAKWLQGLGVSARAASVAVKGLMVSTGVTAAVLALSWAVDKLSSSTDKLSDTIDDTEKGSKKWGESLTDVSEAVDSATAKEIGALERLYNAAVDERKSRKERIEAAKELQGTYADTFKGLETEAILAGGAAEAYDKLKKSIIEVATAKASQTKIEQNQTEWLGLELDKDKLSEELAANRSELKKIVDDEARAFEESQKSSLRLLAFPYEDNQADKENIRVYQNYQKRKEELNAGIKATEEAIKKIEEDQGKLNAANDKLYKYANQKPQSVVPKVPITPTGQTFDTSMGYENFTQLGQYEQYLSELAKQRLTAHGEELRALDELIAKVKAAKQAFENGFRIDDSMRNFGKDGKVIDPAKLPSVSLPKLATVADLAPTVDLSNIYDAFDEMKRASEEASQTMEDNMLKGWSGLKGVAGGIDSITEAINGDGSAWERITGIIDGTISVFQGVQAAMQAATAISALYTAAKKTEGAAAKESASSTILDALAKLFEAHSWIPFVGIGIAGAMAGAMLATMFSAPKFAKGGIAYGPTLGLFGEYPGASNNPEVVAPLDKLRKLIQPSDGGLGGEVRFRIEGTDLVGILERRGKYIRRI